MVQNLKTSYFIKMIQKFRILDYVKFQKMIILNSNQHHKEQKLIGIYLLNVFIWQINHLIFQAKLIFGLYESFILKCFLEKNLLDRDQVKEQILKEQLIIL
ncbi:unnamed protein product [Paramecium sonneborni]|uniref:Uncharacterized protein n=1 Tax=Paramecium sonneborni TaxID=65129 RepID=A0A8S1K950_9CILI|nr:unnamed protein product [Paramecium sonneborni]